MALRSPNTFHNYWGIVATPGELPNAPGNVIVSSPLNLEAGDIAFVSGESTLYLCTSPGTVNNGGDAIWAPLYSGIDHFAPKYVVGGSEDSQIPFSVGGFYYFPDDGTGNGIQAAFNFINAGGPVGDVYIRPGYYQLDALAAAGGIPFIIPDGCKVQGAGDSTHLAYIVVPGGAAEAFSLQTGSELSDIKIDVQDDTGDPTSSGRTVVSCSSLDRAYCSRVKITLLQNFTSTSNLDSCIHVYNGTLYLDTCYLSYAYTGPYTNNPEVGGRAGLRTAPECVMYRCNISGKDFGVVSYSPTAYRLLIDQSTIFGATAVYGTGYVNITGSTELTAYADSDVAYGVNVEQGFAPVSTVLVNGARIVVDPTNVSSTGIKSNCNTGQIIGSNIIAPVGIDTSAGAGAGHAIGFNIIQSNPGLEITSALMDEVAHNIFV